VKHANQIRALRDFFLFHDGTIGECDLSLGERHVLLHRLYAKVDHDDERLLRITENGKAAWARFQVHELARLVAGEAVDFNVRRSLTRRGLLRADRHVTDAGREALGIAEVRP
jgi:hypothetical protein